MQMNGPVRQKDCWVGSGGEGGDRPMEDRKVNEEMDGEEEPRVKLLKFPGWCTNFLDPGAPTDIQGLKRLVLWEGMWDSRSSTCNYMMMCVQSVCPLSW